MGDPLLKPKLIGNCRVPRGGSFTLNLPERGMIGEGTTFDVLLTNIRAYRNANGIPIGLGFSQEVEWALCEKYPDECKQIDFRMPTGGRVGWLDVLAGTKLVFKHKLAGSPIVSDEEAERRAKICLSCPWHQDIEWPCGGGTCGELKDYVQDIIGSKRTSVDPQLKSCGICKCWVGIAVFVPLELQRSVLTSDQKAQFETAALEWNCWKHQAAPETV